MYEKNCHVMLVQPNEETPLGNAYLRPPYVKHSGQKEGSVARITNYYPRMLLKLLISTG